MEKSKNKITVRGASQSKKSGTVGGKGFLKPEAVFTRGRKSFMQERREAKQKEPNRMREKDRGSEKEKQEIKKTPATEAPRAHPGCGISSVLVKKWTIERENMGGGMPGGKTTLGQSVDQKKKT